MGRVGFRFWENGGVYFAIASYRCVNGASRFWKIRHRLRETTSVRRKERRTCWGRMDTDCIRITYVFANIALRRLKVSLITTPLLIAEGWPGASVAERARRRAPPFTRVRHRSRRQAARVWGNNGPTPKPPRRRRNRRFPGERPAIFARGEESILICPPEESIASRAALGNSPAARAYVFRKPAPPTGI